MLSTKESRVETKGGEITALLPRKNCSVTFVFLAKTVLVIKESLDSGFKTLFSSWIISDFEFSKDESATTLLDIIFIPLEAKPLSLVLGIVFSSMSKIKFLTRLSYCASETSIP